MASVIRRKPLITYKSPTAEEHAFIRSPSTNSTRTTIETQKASPVPSSSCESPVASTSQNPRRRAYPLSPPLPLFHPFGPLAMSLPPLDPTQYGLPIPSVPDERDYLFAQITRSRRPVPKLREPEDDAHVMASSTVSAIAAVAARETKERASPKKRRAGGAKRKRRDAEDGDPTYPAKRTRPSRGAQEQTQEDDSPADLVPTGAVTPEGGLSDANDVSKRRSTRAKGNLKRRDSSASETSTSPLAQTKNTDTDTVPNAKAEDILNSTAVPIDNDEKEEGELSEEPGTS